MAWLLTRGRWTQLVAPKIAVGDDWYAARLTETRRRVVVPESAGGERVEGNGEKEERLKSANRRSRLVLVCMSCSHRC